MRDKKQNGEKLKANAGTVMNIIVASVASIPREKRQWTERKKITTSKRKLPKKKKEKQISKNKLKETNRTQ